MAKKILGEITESQDSTKVSRPLEISRHQDLTTLFIEIGVKLFLPVNTLEFDYNEESKVNN